MTTTLLAVNGTLMRGLELNPNMQKAGGIFVREDRTDAHYRLWSINDRHPGMIRVNRRRNTRRRRNLAITAGQFCRSVNERTRWAGNWQNQTCRW